MDWRRGICFGCVLILALVTCSGVVAAQEFRTEEGATVPMPDDFYEEWSTEIEDFKQLLDQPDSEAWLLITSDMTYVVISDNAPDVGTGRVRGQFYQGFGEGYGFINLSEFENTTSVQQVDSEDVKDSPEEFEFSYIRTTGLYSQFAFGYDSADGYVKQPELHGTLEELSFRKPTTPGRIGYSSSWELSRDLENSDQTTYINTRMLPIAEPYFLAHRFGYTIVGTETTIRGVVLPRHPADPGTVNRPTVVYISSTSIEAKPVHGVQSVADGEVQEGQIVQLQASLYGTSLSSKEVLLAASTCDGKLTIGWGICVPAVTDATIDAGVAAGGGSIVPFAAAHNELQEDIAESLTGEYQIKAEVVAADEIHPGLKGPGLRIYEAEQTGGSKAKQHAQSEGETISSLIREHLEQPPDSNDEYESEAAQERYSVGVTPTPTSAPQVTETALADDSGMNSTPEDGAGDEDWVLRFVIRTLTAAGVIGIYAGLIWGAIRRAGLFARRP